MRLIHFFGVGLLILLVGCASPSPSLLSPSDEVGVPFSPYVCVEQSCVFVEVADTPAERELGLMNRSKLAQDAGMLFVFDEAEIHSFWMKNTLIPLDALWISSENKVVDILLMTPCVEDPCPVYTPSGPFQYVLEVNGGWAKDHHVQIGDTVFIFTE